MDSFTGQGTRRVRLAWGGCLMALVALGGTAQAEESPLLEHVDQMMIDIGSQLTNAKKKLSLSTGVVEENPNGESGMGLTCCTRNLSTIAEKLNNIRAAIDRMAVFYSEQENGQAIGILGELDSRVLSVSTGAAIFGRAPDIQSARAALTGFVRPWNEFRNGVQSLKICCPVPLPVDPDPASSTVPDEEPSDKKGKKGKDKKSKKKSEDDSDDAGNPGV